MSSLLLLVPLATGGPCISRLTNIHDRTVAGLPFEGVVAKKLTSPYGRPQQGSVKLKNPNYWRRDSEIEATQQSRERRTRVLA
jgi:hypothetical protein